MPIERPERPPLEAPLDRLERALIAEFVRGRGYDPDKLADLPEDTRHALLGEASVYASARLTEIESRSRYVHDLHDINPATHRRRPS